MPNNRKSDDTPPPLPASSKLNSDGIGVGEDYSEEFTSKESIDGLPLALQLMGPRGADWKLLQIGQLLESLVSVPRTVLTEPSWWSSLYVNVCK